MLMLACTACLKEGDDGCPAYLSLSFAHNNSTREFDSEIGNDVYLHIYGDDIYHGTKFVPYSSIKGGREIQLRKEWSGEMDLVAWAIPSGSMDHGLIPGCDDGERKSAKVVGLNVKSGSVCHPMGDLFLGTIRDTDPQDVGGSYRVSLTNCVCRVKVTVNGATHFFGSDPATADATLEIEGSKSQMTLDLTPCGDDAIVEGELTHKPSENSLTSDVMGLLPSADNQFLVVTAYRNGTPVFKVDTGEKSVPGATVNIEINMGVEAIIYVNGWRVRSVSIEQY